MCDKAVDSRLGALTFVPDWFISSKMTEKLDTAVYYIDYISFSDLNPDFVTFSSRDIGLSIITFDNINLNGDHFDYCDPETIIHVKLMSWHNKCKQLKVFKKRWMKNCHL